MTDQIGKHCLAELTGCNPIVLNDAPSILDALKSATDASGATWIQGHSHNFEPEGVTAVGLLAESHIAIHTWPSQQQATVDCFTCGQSTDPHAACLHLAQTLQATDSTIQTINRSWPTSHEPVKTSVNNQN